MTTDTKVGLIVGLAFIVVFAIILSNRGQQSQLAPPLVDLADAEAPLDPLLQNHARDAGTMSLFAQSNERRPDVGDAVVESPMRRIFEPPRPRTENHPVDASPLPQTERRVPALPEATHTREPITPPIDTPMLPPARNETSTLASSNGRPATNVVGGKTREVQRGDSLAKIAKDAYGSDEKALVDALAEVNNLNSPDHIVIGQKLRIPPIEALAASVGAARPPTTSAPERATAPAVADKTYVVQAGDTLTSIARAQLGSTARWKEIQTLNKLTDPNRVVEGMTLKLPPASVADARRSARE